MAAVPFDLAALRRRCTPADVLRCDACGGDLTDENTRSRSMIFWNPDQSGTLVLAHKGGCDPDPHPRSGSHGYSAELDWFNRPMGALRRLAGIVLEYKFTETEVRRLALIAWAIAEVSAGGKEPLDPIDLA